MKFICFLKGEPKSIGPGIRGPILEWKQFETYEKAYQWWKARVRQDVSKGIDLIMDYDIYEDLSNDRQEQTFQD